MTLNSNDARPAGSPRSVSVAEWKQPSQVADRGLSLNPCWLGAKQPVRARISDYLLRAAVIGNCVQDAISQLDLFAVRRKPLLFVSICDYTCLK
jgi:hypothetical protein